MTVSTHKISVVAAYDSPQADIPLIKEDTAAFQAAPMPGQIRMLCAALAISVLFFGAWTANADEPESPTQKPTLVINLTSGTNDLHAAVMGLHFAEHGLADGREVVIFFNVKSPPLARKTLDDDVRLEEMPPVRSIVADLLEQGAKMVVCPMCAKVNGVEADELATGIQMIEDRKQIFDHLHANSVVFTY